MNDQTASEDAYPTPPEDAYPLPDEAPVAVPATVVTSTIQTLQHFEEFFRHHASPAVQAELRAFCVTQGWHGVCGAEALLDDLGWDAFALRHARDAVANPPAAPQDPR
jgi:hypothetical protein